jgi:hypothetical protein
MTGRSDADLVVLAPARPPLAALAERVARLLAKADHQAMPAQDERALFADLFAMVPGGWPVAALTRQADAGDAQDHAWLRADPAHFRVEPGSVRLLACGDLGQDADEVAALVAALAPVFGDEGFELSAPHPARWYLRPFLGNAAPDLPDLPAPALALGGDLFALWPEDDRHRRWRRLFNEAQIVLAQLPGNRERIRAGRPAVNGLWFHGAGPAPARVGSALRAIDSSDPLLRALAAAAGVPGLEPVPVIGHAQGPALIDLRGDIDGSALAAMLAAWDAGRLRSIEWRAPSGRWLRRRWHALRIWRRASMGSTPAAG